MMALRLLMFDLGYPFVDLSKAAGCIRLTGRRLLYFIVEKVSSLYKKIKIY
jgi:hypothetical protein